MDLSYAQHLEDYHLSLAFAGQREGFYVDVGAGHPVADNVSCWFYLQGWRGLVVEPQADLAALYAHVRPRDLVFAGLVGAESGETDFHVVDRLHGFSTMKADVAGLSGAGFATKRLPIATLTQLARKHNLPKVDFLKIDVEGAEIEIALDNQVAARTQAAQFGRAADPVAAAIKDQGILVFAPATAGCDLQRTEPHDAARLRLRISKSAAADAANSEVARRAAKAIG
jgi:FkbM family methyltransferase